MAKSDIAPADTTDLDCLGRSYYAYLIEQAYTSIRQARVLVCGDIVDSNHELPTIERLLRGAYEAL